MGALLKCCQSYIATQLTKSILTDDVFLLFSTEQQSNALRVKRHVKTGNHVEMGSHER